MAYVVWAQTMVEYGAIAAVTTKLSSVYSQIELSLRYHPETWMFGVAAALLGFWLLRRR